MKEIKEILKSIALVLDKNMPHLFYHISIADPETEESGCVSNLEKEKMISFLKYQLEEFENINDDGIEVLHTTDKRTEH